MRKILTSTALATLLATGAYAQTEPATDEEQAPAVESEEAPAEVMPEAETAEDPAAAEDPAMAEDPAAAEDPAMAEDPAAAEDPAMAEEDADVIEEDVEDPALAEDPAMADDPAVAAGTMGDENWTQVENEALSVEALNGSDIQTADGESIATVDDVLLTPEGQVENVVATFGGFLGFGTNTVLLTMDEIEVWADESDNIIVRSNLTPEDLEGRAEYEVEEEAVEG